MAKTDQPFKRLITLIGREFAAWVLNTDVRSAKLLPSEHTSIPDPIHSDLLFDVTLADGRSGLMPVEFQGRSSARPVRFRVLDYMTRITINEEPDILHCVVVYVGKSSHATDSGTHQIAGLKDYPTFLWHYQVIHLWKMQAEELLHLDRPALLPLVGQTKMKHPEIIIPQVVARLKAVPDPTFRNNLLAELLALMDKEKLTMTEQILEKEDVVFDSPYLRRIREEAQKEAQKEWLAKGREEGHILTLRKDILEALSLRLDPPSSIYLAIGARLDTITDYQTLRSLFKHVIQAKNTTEFQQAMDEATNNGDR